MMIKIFKSPVIWSVLFAMCVVLTGCNSAHVIYVDSAGKDLNPGTIDMPVATLERAMEMIRESKEGDGKRISQVVLREGVYYLSETLRFGSSDSGTENQPLLFTNYDEEQVTISGASLLDCEWEEYRNGIYTCSLPAFKDKTFAQLFVDGKRQVRARYPNGKYLNAGKDAFLYPEGADEWPHSKVYYDPETFTNKEWENPEEAILHIFPHHHWGNLQYRIAGINDEEHSILIESREPQINETYFKTWDEPGTWISERSNYFIDNVFEELDAEGEWYFDKNEATLYYKPPDAVDMESAVIEVPVLKELIHLEGSPDSPVKHIQFKNIRFTGTTVTYMDQYEYPSLGDWGIVRSGAVMIEDAEHCGIEDCFFDATGGNAVFVNHYASSIEIEGNIFSECGESAVCMVGKSHLNDEKSYQCQYCGAQHPWGWDEPSNEIPSNCLIKDNLIYDIGVFGKQVAGVFLALTKKNTVSHNHIYNTPRAGICINDGWHGGHVIEFNDLHNTVRETGDHGPFNSWGREPFWCHRQSHGQGASHPAGEVLQYAQHTTQIRNNRFADNSGWGIDLDDGSSNYRVYNNLCIGISVKLREGDYRTVENNIFYKGANPPSIHRGYENNHDVFRKNVVVTDHLAFHFIFPPEQGKWIEQLDSNVYYNHNGKFVARVNAGNRDFGMKDPSLEMEEWNKLGFDRHSIIADPLLRDPEGGDFSMEPNSPAFDLGFKEFPLNEFGLTEDFDNTWADL